MATVGVNGVGVGAGCGCADGTTVRTGSGLLNAAAGGTVGWVSGWATGVLAADAGGDT